MLGTLLLLVCTLGQVSFIPAECEAVLNPGVSVS